MKMNRIIVEAVLAGKSQSQVAEQYGNSQPRVSQLLTRWRHAGRSAQIQTQFSNDGTCLDYLVWLTIRSTVGRLE